MGLRTTGGAAVGVGVAANVGVGVGVLVGVGLAVGEGVGEGVAAGVEVAVGVEVGVVVGVGVGDDVGVGVGVEVGVMLAEGVGVGVPPGAPIRRGSNEVSMIRGGVMALAIVCHQTTFSFWGAQFPLPPLLLLWSGATKSPCGNAGPRGKLVTSIPSVPVTSSMPLPVTILNSPICALSPRL